MGLIGEFFEWEKSPRVPGGSETTKICYTFVDVPNPRDFSACV